MIGLQWFNSALLVTLGDPNETQGAMEIVMIGGRRKEMMSLSMKKANIYGMT